MLLVMGKQLHRHIRRLKVLALFLSPDRDSGLKTPVQQCREQKHLS